MEKKHQKQRYAKIDGLRSFAAVGIVLMHVLANIEHELTGVVFERIIPSFTDFVFLFMIISGFAICCGYYEEFITGQLPLEQFYKRRVLKVWPFFALLCLMEFLVSPSVESLCEVFTNLTLCFGFLPNHGIKVKGVGWFLGLTFVFYFLFPLFCYLLSNKKRAWISIGVALILNYLCENYFSVGRENIIYSAVFFLLGGVIYLYRIPLQKLAENFSLMIILSIIGFSALYYIIEKRVVIMLLLYGFMLIYALRGKQTKHDLLDNPITKLLSSISMEIYLSHMAVFRLVEITIGGYFQRLNNNMMYAAKVILTLAGTVFFSLATKRLIFAMQNIYLRKK